MLPMGIESIGYQANNHPVGFQIYYLAEGRDIVRFDSLVIEAIKTPEGIDISKLSNGEPAYESGHFPLTSADGKYCVFSLIVSQNQLGKVDRLSIKGHATILVATKRAEEKLGLDVADKGVKKAGPFSVQVKPSRSGVFPSFVIPPTVAPSTDRKPSELTPARPIRPNAVDVRVTGPLKSLISARFMDGNDRLEPSCMWDDTERTYTIPKPKAGEVSLTLKYAVELKEAHLPLEK